MSDNLSNDGTKPQTRAETHFLGHHWAWCVEKSENGLMALARLGELLKRSQAPEEAFGELRIAMNSATKLLAFSCSEDFSERWTPDDPSFVVNGGEVAARMLLHRYNTGKNVNVWRSLGEFFDELEPLLNVSEPWNRTQVHELLRRFPKGCPKPQAMRLVEDMVEERTQGKMEWGAFVEAARVIIKDGRESGALEATWPVPPKVPYY